MCSRDLVLQRLQSQLTSLFTWYHVKLLPIGGGCGWRGCYLATLSCACVVAWWCWYVGCCVRTGVFLFLREKE